MSSKERTSQPTHNKRSQQHSISSNSYANKKHQHSVLQQQSQNQISQQSQSSSHQQKQSMQTQKSSQQMQSQDSQENINQVQGMLPDKLDTHKVIEMIKNADLYDLINISLRSSELKNEQVEQFIQRALTRGQNQITNQKQQLLQDNSYINNQQLDNLFTPPSKVGQRQNVGLSTSPNNKLLLSNDENQNILTVENHKIKQSNLNIRQQHHNRSQQVQQPLQPSILQNATNIQNNENQLFIHNPKHVLSQQQQYVHHHTSSKSQMMEQFLQQLAIRQAQLDQEDSCYESQADHLMMEDEECHNQIPREAIPQPYSDLPTSPTEENLPQSTIIQENEQRQSQQQQSMHHFRNDSFSNQDFAYAQIIEDKHKQNYDQMQRLQQQLNPYQEGGYRGDQFSFQLKIRESITKRSPGSSNYSTLKDSYQSSGKKQQRKSEQKSSRKYENQLKMQHSMKYQQQQNDQPQQLNRTLSNFRAFQQQNTLNRSISTNQIQKQDQSRSFINNNNQESQSFAGLTKTGSTKNLNQHQLLKKSFLQQSTSQMLNDSINKTPKASRNIGISINNTGSMTQRMNPTQLTPQNMNDQDRLSIMQRRSIEFRKQQLLAQLSQLNIMHIRELQRIKKPSSIVYLTGRLVCQFFYLFNVSTQSKQLHMEDLIEWEQIQQHINLHIMKYFNDLQQQIKIKLLNQESMNNAQKEILEIKLTQLKEQYFTGENMKIFRHLNTNKNMQTIVNYILSVINFFNDSKNNDQQRESSLVNENLEEQRSFAYPGHNYDALITQRAQEKRSRDQQLESSQTRGKSRNYNLNNKNDTTPTTTKTQMLEKTEQQQTLQKSASRNLLLRRDRSQLLQNNQSIQLNKSPMNKNNRDISFNKSSNIDQNKNEMSVSRKERNDSVIQNSVKRNLMSSRQRVQSKSPINAHRKININQTLNQSQIPSSRIAQQVSEFAQKNSDLLQKLEYNQDINEEVPLELDYKLMIESSEINAKIRESTAAIEENMKFLQSPQSVSNVDMGLIEQIKQRRKEQLEREKSQDRNTHSSQTRENIMQEQL